MTDQTKQTYPIVLAHGIARFDATWNPLVAFIHRYIARLDRWADRFQYFRNVASMLRSHGYVVFNAHVSFAANVKHRAAELKLEVLRALKETGAEKVNIIAHSMGGLDARHMIAHLGMDKCVDTLVTIGTPHLGTSFADWGLEHRGDLILKRLSRVISLDGLLDLTTTSCEAFNKRALETELTNDVRYIVYAASQDCEDVFLPLQSSWGIIAEKEGENDGLVSVDSQLWQKWLRRPGADEPSKFISYRYFPFPADHFNECGWWDLHEKAARKDYEAQVLRVYLDIAQLCDRQTS